MEDNPTVGEIMDETTGKFSADTDCKLALALVRKKKSGEYRVVKTSGEMSDCLKEGTRWDGMETDIHEYVKERSLYPSYSIEHQTLGKAEYYLTAIAEVDVLGAARQSVLDCFYEMVQAEIGPAISGQDAKRQEVTR